MTHYFKNLKSINFTTNTIATSEITATNVTAGQVVKSNTGQVHGKQISGGTWYKVYQITTSTNDHLSMHLTTKDIDSDVVCRKDIYAGASPSSSQSTFTHNVESGSAINQPRVAVFAPAVPLTTQEIVQTQNDSTTLLTSAKVMYQTFFPVTGKPIIQASILTSGTTAGGTITATIRTMADVVLGTTTYSTIANVGLLWIDFNFITPIAITAGVEYKLHIVTNIDVTIVYNSLDVYVGSSFLTGTTIPEHAFIISTNADSFPVSDIYIYAQPDTSSITEVKIDSSGTLPIWSAEGTATWPSGYPTGTELFWDSDTAATNTKLRIGSVSLEDITQAVWPATAATKIDGGVIIKKNTLIGGELTLYDTAATNSVSIKSPAAVSSSYTLSFSNTSPTGNQIIKTDATGQLGWMSKPNLIFTITSQLFTVGSSFSIVGYFPWIQGRMGSAGQNITGARIILDVDTDAIDIDVGTAASPTLYLNQTGVTTGLKEFALGSIPATDTRVQVRIKLAAAAVGSKVYGIFIILEQS